MKLVFEEVFEEPTPFVEVLKTIHILEDLASKRLSQRRKWPLRIRKLLAYPEYNTRRYDHSHTPSQVARAPADKATIGRVPVVPIWTGLDKIDKQYSLYFHIYVNLQIVLLFFLFFFLHLLIKAEFMTL